MYSSILKFFFALKAWASLRALCLETKGFILDNWKVYHKIIKSDEKEKKIKYKKKIIFKKT